MTVTKLKRVLTGIGISSFEGVQLPGFKNFILSANQYINPDVHFVTFDFDNELIKIKYRKLKIAENGDKVYNPVTTNKYDVYLDMNQVVEIETLADLKRNG